jgi:hypothetical protein
MPDSRITISPRDRVTVTHAPYELHDLGEMPPVISEALTKAAKRKNAEQQIKMTWTSLGGAPGGETGDLMEIGVGFYRQYGGNSRIYFRPGHRAINVYGAIGDKYTQLGGPDSWLGWPTSIGEPPSEQPLTKVVAYQHSSMVPSTGGRILGNELVTLLCDTQGSLAFLRLTTIHFLLMTSLTSFSALYPSCPYRLLLHERASMEQVKIVQEVCR